MHAYSLTLAHMATFHMCICSVLFSHASAYTHTFMYIVQGSRYNMCVHGPSPPNLSPRLISCEVCLSLEHHTLLHIFPCDIQSRIISSLTPKQTGSGGCVNTAGSGLPSTVSTGSPTVSGLPRSRDPPPAPEQQTLRIRGVTTCWQSPIWQAWSATVNQR